MKIVSSVTGWSQPSAPLDLQAHQVDVWRARLDLPVDLLDKLEATLSEEERGRARRFRFPGDQKRFIAAHGCLRDVLGRYLHCEPDHVSFLVNPYGKPLLRDHDLEFNLSHSGDFTLIAITRARRIGIDVECVRDGISPQLIASRFFTKAEIAELESLQPEQRQTAFFTCWTRKEAYIKAQGLGLSLPLDSFDVSLAPGEPALLRHTRPDREEAVRWTLFALDVDPRYQAAVAIRGQNLQLRLWDWNSTHL